MPDAEDDQPVGSHLKPSFSNLFGLFALPHVGLFYGGRTLAAIGVWMEQLATGWLVWEMTGSATWLGVITFLRLAPSIILGPIGGVLADRMWPLDLMRLCKVAVVSGFFLLTLLLALDLLTIWSLGVLIAFIGSAQSLANPANKAFVWHLVPKHWLPVAIPVGSITFNLAAFVGPAAAGALIAWQGVLTAYVVTLCLQAVFLAVLLRLKLPPNGEDNHRIADAGQIGLSRSLVDGARYIAHDASVRAVLVLHLLFAVCARPLIPLMPAIAVVLFGGGPQTVGLLTACIGAGAIVGGLWLASRSRVEGMAQLLLLFMIVLMTLVIALALVRWTPAGFVILFAIGACMIVRASGTQTLLQFAVDNQMRGRVMGYYGLFLKGGSAVGALLVGALADLTTLPTALMTAAVLGGAGLVAMSRSFLAAGRKVEALE
ncbi:MFS transporter [Ahrensia marina]|uniref:MFS transporter n=1 Tax=Ahrensia marina TaxID=1514904 RepID=UPI0035D0FCBE